MQVPIYHREDLAKKIIKRTLSPKGLSGLFLAAPRRTGKSTFVKEDIAPYLNKQNVEVIYVDLWADRSRDPAELIRDAIRAHLLKNENLILQWARKGGLDKIKVAGFELDVGKVGVGTSITFANALKQLSAATERQIVLVIDEAQQALESEAGMNTLFALKAVRDELNGSEFHGFRIIATGSNRDKLSLLVNGKDQAFMGAVLLELEPLNQDYLLWEMDHFEGDYKPSLEALQAVFAGASYRPETLRKVLDDLAFDLSVTKQNVDQKLREGLVRVVSESKRSFMMQFNSLPPLQAAVLTVMAVTDVQFAPYRPHSFELYRKECERLSTSPVNITDEAVQYALDALRKKTLIWNSQRGVYRIEDVQHKEWLAEDFYARNPELPRLSNPDMPVRAQWELAESVATPQPLPAPTPKKRTQGSKSFADPHRLPVPTPQSGR